MAGSNEGSSDDDGASSRPPPNIPNRLSNVAAFLEGVVPFPAGIGDPNPTVAYSRLPTGLGPSRSDRNRNQFQPYAAPPPRSGIRRDPLPSQPSGRFVDLTRPPILIPTINRTWGPLPSPPGGRPATAPTVGSGKAIPYIFRPNPYCSICLNEIRDGDVVVTCRNGHTCHANEVLDDDDVRCDGFDKWRCSRRDASGLVKCPTCRMMMQRKCRTKI